MGFGRGSRAGQLCSLWPGLPQPQPPIAHGCGETSQTSSGVCQGQMAEPRAAAAGKAADVQESGTGKTERLLPTGQPSPEISSLPGVRLVLTSSMSFLSLECCVSGLTRAPPSMSLPSCWGQSAFCLAVSLCKKPEVGLRNKTEGREGGDKVKGGREISLSLEQHSIEETLILKLRLFHSPLAVYCSSISV